MELTEDQRAWLEHGIRKGVITSAFPHPAIPFQLERMGLTEQTPDSELPYMPKWTITEKGKQVAAALLAPVSWDYL